MATHSVDVARIRLATEVVFETIRTTSSSELPIAEPRRSRPGRVRTGNTAQERLFEQQKGHPQLNEGQHYAPKLPEPHDWDPNLTQQAPNRSLLPRGSRLHRGAREADSSRFTCEPSQVIVAISRRFEQPGPDSVLDDTEFSECRVPPGIAPVYERTCRGRAAVVRPSPQGEGQKYR